MRVGLNPQKDVPHGESPYDHQVILPVYIPTLQGYFAESAEILKLCIDSLTTTINNKTFITIVNNGSCIEIATYLDDLLKKNLIHELVHTENIGKLNAIIKGLAGNNIPLVTISDADTLFVSGWQQATVAVFNKIPKAGIVGLVPQMKTFRYNCGNVICDNLFNKKMQFMPIADSDAMVKYYDSIGWDRNYNHDRTKYSLGIASNGIQVIVGSGHFAATYRKDIFDEIKTYLGYKLGGDSEAYLDKLPLEKDYWRLTTFENFAFHMGNIPENWMREKITMQASAKDNPLKMSAKRDRINKVDYFLKNTLFYTIFKIPFIHQQFLSLMKLPAEMRKTY